MVNFGEVFDFVNIFDVIVMFWEKGLNILDDKNVIFFVLEVLIVCLIGVV